MDSPRPRRENRHTLGNDVEVPLLSQFPQADSCRDSTAKCVVSPERTVEASHLVRKEAVLRWLASAAVQLFHARLNTRTEPTPVLGAPLTWRCYRRNGSTGFNDLATFVGSDLFVSS